MSDEIIHNEKESKAEAFRRIGVPRVENVLDRIRVLGNLADKTRYDYTQEQVDKIEHSIKEALDDTISKFRGKVDKDKFTL